MDRALWLKFVLVYKRGTICSADKVRLEAAFLHQSDILLPLKSLTFFFPSVRLMKQPLWQPRGSLAALKGTETRAKLSLAVAANQLRAACISLGNLGPKGTVLLNLLKLFCHLCSISFRLFITVRLSQNFPSVSLGIIPFDHLSALLIDLGLKRALFIESLLCSC
jgi:hypothetical protein